MGVLALSEAFRIVTFGLVKPQIQEERDKPSKRELLIVGITSLAFFTLAVRAAISRSLYFDEIASFTVATRPSLPEFFRALPYDGNPPIFFLLARVCLSLPLPKELALRLPSILGWLLAGLLSYAFVRRNTSGLFATAAMSLYFGGTLVGTAALEGRPYALLIFFTASAMCAWQSATVGRHRYLAHLTLALATTGAILTHQYGVIYVAVPVFTGEIIRSWRARKTHFSVITATCTGWFALIFTVPAALKAQAPLLSSIKLCPGFHDRPRLENFAAYSQTMPVFAPFALISCLLVVVIFFRKARPSSETFPSHAPRPEEVGATISLALLIPIMLFVTKIGTGYFVERYAVGAGLGMALCIPLLLSFWRHSAFIHFLCQGIIVYSLTMGCLAFLIARPHQSAALEGLANDPLFLTNLHQENIVIGDPLTFSPTWWYSSSSARERIHYLTDLHAAALRTDNPTAEFSLYLEQPYGAPTIDSYKDFLDSHGEFLLYLANDRLPSWIKERLLREGWTLSLIGSEGDRELYRVERSRPDIRVTK